MKRILISGGTLVFIGALVVSATGAFFSDTETSTGNTFAAGDIDLQIDNESYAIDCNIEDSNECTGALVANPNNSWDLTDLVAGTHKFFEFFDIKPGDYGEDTISIHVGSNDAWMCAAARLTADNDNTYTEPEEDDDLTVDTNNPTTTDGELDDILQFAFWADDGDNVYEPGGTNGSQETIFLSGPLSGLDDAGQIALADSQGGAFGNQPVPGDEVIYIGKIWCAGDLVSTNLPQDGLDTVGPTDLRGTGFTCDGSLVNNAAQTDIVEGDMQFYAVQARNNPNFTCAGDYTPEWPTPAARAEVGADLATYVAPTGGDCDVNVPGDSATIQGAIDHGDTVNGDTICVAAGTYNEDVNITKEVELAGAGAASTFIVGQTAGEPGAVAIAANNVTVRGFDIIDAVGGIAALRINGAHSGILINSNRLRANGANAFLTNGGVSSVDVTNNVLDANGTASQLAYVNGTASVAVVSSDVDFFENTFIGTMGVAGGVVLGNEATGADITENDFASTLTSTYAILESFEDDANVNFNNFNGAGGVKVKDSDAGAGPLDAENNWWGAAVPAGHTSGDVDDVPKEASAFPLN